MTTFTIDGDNNIMAFGSAEEAAAGATTPFDSFTSQKELAELAAAWPAERLVAIWNSLPGVKPVEGFKSPRGPRQRAFDCSSAARPLRLGRACRLSIFWSKSSGGQISTVAVTTPHSSATATAQWLGI
jgi:hypothetical protein